jgi:hypothetical protein
MAEKPARGNLQLTQDLTFERREWTTERIGWAVMAVIILAALTGVFGAGPLSRATVGEPGGQFRVDYPRFARFKAPMTLGIHLGPHTGRQGMARLWLSREYLDGVQIAQVTPQPQQVSAGAEQLTYAFPISEANGSTSVTFFLKAERFGRHGGCAGLVNGPTACFRQFIYP